MKRRFPRPARAGKRLLCALALLGLLTSCARADAPQTQSEADAQYMSLDYAEEFTVEYQPDGCSLITIGGEQRYLLVPEDGAEPEELDPDVTVLRQPLTRLYVAASSAMDLFLQLDALDAVRLTSTTREDWSLEEVRAALDAGELRYTGRYSAPDYEQILSEQCGLAIESTMIYHSPETMEQLERLGVPVLVERSSYESHPLGRVEWIKLYGLLLGKEAEAEAFYQQTLDGLEGVLDGEPTGKTAAFFYITSNGVVNVRKPGDYISRMIELAGGQYIFSAEDLSVEENDLSTMNLQMEAFYAGAKDADVLIYNSTIEGELDTLDQLLEKNPLLADFRAVKRGEVWCTGKNMFQRTSGAGAMIADLHAVFAGESKELTYLHRLS